MSAIIKSIESGVLNAEISIVISNKPDAKGLDVASAHGIHTKSFKPLITGVEMIMNMTLLPVWNHIMLIWLFWPVI